MKVEKSDKTVVKFDRNKVIQTCMVAGAKLALAKRIAQEVAGEGYDGITTDEIRMSVYKKLKKIDVDYAERYVARSNMRVRTSSDILEYFDNERIIKSLVDETGVNLSFAKNIAKDVEKELGRMRLNYVTAPLIREIVNVKLLEGGMESVRARYTRLGMPVYDVKKLLDGDSSEVVRFSPEAVHKVMSDRIGREYAMLNIMPFDLADAHMCGQIHIHDLNYFPLKPTTFSHDIRVFLKKGLKVDGTGEYIAVSGPAKRPAAAFMHSIKALIAGQTEVSREQYLEDFNYLMAPYVVGLPYDKIRQLAQMVAYEISQTAVGHGGQSIYANLCMDTSLPKHMKEMPAVQPGGKVIRSVKYGDYEDEAEAIFEAFAEVMAAGDNIGKPFIYPRIVVNRVSKRDDEKLGLMAPLTARFGTPVYMKGGRQFYGNRRGTIQHVTINLPQLAYQKREDIGGLLDNRLKKAFEVLLLKRKVMNHNLEANLVPFLKQKAAGVRYFNPQKQLYVISYAGLNELSLLCAGAPLEKPEGARYGTKIVRQMARTVKTFKEESGLDIILTGDPKGISYSKFAATDAKRYPDKALVRGGQNPYYSKGHYVDCKKLGDKLDIEGRFNLAVSGRTMTHIRLAQGRIDPEQIHELVSKTLSRKDVVYLSLSRGITICVKCGYSQQGKSGRCTRCKGRGVSIWGRDTGNLQNIRGWSPNQKQAFVEEHRYFTDGGGKLLAARLAKTILRM